MKLILTLFMLTLCFFKVFSQKTTLNWTFLHPIKKIWIDAETHGSVQQSLISNKELPDPFYGLNETEFNWIEDYKWEFKSSFTLSESQLKSNFIEIEFPGIDTYAEVYLNDIFLFKSENNFRPYYSQIKNSIRQGENSLKVIFTPPVMYHTDRFNNEKFHYPATNDVGKIPIASYCRKPQYQFGWDWALRMNTIGFLKPVSIHCYNNNRIIGKNCSTQFQSEETANLDFTLILSDSITEPILWRSKIFGDKYITSKKDLIRSEVIISPKLWWPRGQGDQNLYFDTWTLLNAKGDIIDSLTFHFGIRKTELIIEPDKWGTSYFVKINGRSIFCKGGDYIPQDIFPTRVKDEQIVKMVELMAESNFNMVRVWGGGYYPDEVFYNTCDKLGLMVWQDLMFACAMYPGDSLFLANVESELEFQIPKIASHPSLTLFNGNNEVDVAWKNWGFQLKYGLYGDDAKQIENDYNRLFKELAPKIINKNTNTPYIHTSPLSNWGKDEYYDHGTMHYWGVWHGKDPIEDFGKKTGRFNAEYGFQSFPEFSTLSSFSKKTEWELDSKVMKHHQKSYVGNGMILKQTKVLFGEPKSFEEFVYLSQLTQSKAVSIAVSAHRTGMPRCMGTLYWQVNDCWQAPTWSSVDYYGNWKALQYSVKKDYEDVAIVSKIEELGKEEFYIVSDVPDSFICELKYIIYDFNGNKIFENNSEINLHQGSVNKVCLECLETELKEKGFVIHFKWTTNTHTENERWFNHLSNSNQKATTEEIKYSLENLNNKDKTVNLIIENSKFIQDFWVSSNNLGVKFSENFLDYLPGKHSIKISFSNDNFSIDELKYFWR